MTTAAFDDPIPVLRPGAAILVRRTDRIQLGSDPEHSTVLDLSPPVTAEVVVRLLHFLREPRTRPELARYLRTVGITRADFGVLAEQLIACDAVLPPPGSPRASHLRVRIHGRGPLTTRLSESLRDVGMLTVTSVQRPRPTDDDVCWAGDGSSGATLTVLADFATHDPAIINRLMRERIPHLTVRVRDGVGIVGPLVLPGLSSCLRCADLHRATLDPQWPLVAAQLLGKPSYAGAATVRATAALAHEQIDQVVAGLGTLDPPLGTDDPPDLIDHTLEFHAHPVRLRRKYWPPHPSCSCGAVAAKRNGCSGTR